MEAETCIGEANELHKCPMCSKQMVVNDSATNIHFTKGEVYDGGVGGGL